MTWRLGLVLLAGLAALAVPAPAVPPALCRQSMFGSFIADDGRVMPVALRLQMRSDENDLGFHGRFRCAAKHDRSRCFLGAATVDAFGLESGSGYRLTQSTHRFVLTRSDPYRVVCTLEGATPYVRGLCVPALGGTFRCAAEGEFGSVSGAFGLAVDTCRPCLFD